MAEDIWGVERDSAEPVVTLGQLAGAHEKQLAFTRDPSRYILALCSRRAGKTSGIAARMLTLALENPGSNQVYIALTKAQAKNVTIWEPIWKPMLKKLGFDPEKKTIKRDETEMIDRFPNGSVCRFTGSDDIAKIETELGSGLDLAVVDECQSARDAVLRPLVDRILVGSLTDRRGTLILAGTVPEVEAGLFWDKWTRSNWSKHNWNQFENPHLPKDPWVTLQEDLDANPGLTIDSPIIQRERFGRFVFDKSATAYTYDKEMNSYEGVQPDWLSGLQLHGGAVCASALRPGMEILSVGIDPGTRDRMAVVVVAWGPGSPHVWQVFEWVAPPKANLTWNQLGEVLNVVNQHYRCSFWHYDAGSSKNELDTFTRIFGVPVIKAADKTDMPGQVRLTNALLTSGKLKVMRGSQLEEDYQKTRWDADARAKGLWRWASAWHPDPADATRYALRPYFEAYKAPSMQRPESPPEMVERLAREAYHPTPAVPYGFPVDPDAPDSYGGSQ